MNDFYKWLAEMAVQEGGVVIAPHQNFFHRVQRTFLDLIRTVPSSIINPPGVHPYDAAMSSRGQWMFVWLPDKDR